MNNTELRSELLGVSKLAAEYCALLENARNMEAPEFVADTLSLLPRIYHSFLALEVSEEDVALEYDYFPSYVDEVFYDSIRRNVETLLTLTMFFLRHSRRI